MTSPAMWRPCPAVADLAGIGIWPCLGDRRHDLRGGPCVPTDPTALTGQSESTFPATVLNDRSCSPSSSCWVSSARDATRAATAAALASQTRGVLVWSRLGGLGRARRYSQRSLQYSGHRRRAPARQVNAMVLSGSHLLTPAWSACLADTDRRSRGGAGRAVGSGLAASICRAVTVRHSLIAGRSQRAASSG
jgi:hypothetical protein